MNYPLILHCFLFVITLSEYLICMKYINNAYNYKNEWFNMLLSIFFTPFYSFLFINDINRKKLRVYFLPENRNKLLFPIGTGIFYTVETIWHKWMDVGYVNEQQDFSLMEIIENDEYLFAYLEQWNYKITRITYQDVK